MPMRGGKVIPRNGKRVSGIVTAVTHRYCNLMDRIHPLTEKETAHIIGVTSSCLRVWRKRRQGPPYFRFGKAIRYSASDVANFVQASRLDPKQPTEARKGINN